MSIQLVNKAAEHLINSTPVLGRKKKKKKEEAVNAYLIKNSKGEGRRKKNHSHKQLERDWTELYGCIK